jgi:hypothetical protein
MSSYENSDSDDNDSATVVYTNGFYADSLRPGQDHGSAATPLIPPRMRKLYHLVGLFGRNLGLPDETNEHEGEVEEPKSVVEPEAAQLREVVEEMKSEEEIPFPEITGQANVNGQGANSEQDDALIVKSRKESKLEGKGFTSKESNGHAVHSRARSQSYRRKSLRDVSILFDSSLTFERTLNEVNQARLFQTFFTINTEFQEEPVYVSEIEHNKVNPQFNEFNLSATAMKKSKISRRFVLTLWGKSQIQTTYRRLLCEYVDLGDLMYMGTNISYEFPKNSVILVLSDGYYLLSKTYKQLQIAPANRSASESFDTPTESTCSFNSIMALSNLQQCIVDSETTKRDAAAHISAMINKKTVLFNLRKNKQQLAHRLNILNKSLVAEQQSIADLTGRLRETKASIQARREYIATQLAKQRQARRESVVTVSNISTDKTVTSTFHLQVQLEKVRIANDLSDIFVIDLISNFGFKFTICGIPLPDYTNRQPAAPQISQAIVKTLGASEDDLIAAAYGFAAQLLTLLSYYFEVPLRYPIQPYGSQSFIIDPISVIQGSRTFPLWTRGSLYFRFQYASFLFNKDIEQFMCSQRLPVFDLKPTLANLKNLLLVLSTEPTGKIM